MHRPYHSPRGLKFFSFLCIPALLCHIKPLLSYRRIHCGRRLYSYCTSLHAVTMQSETRCLIGTHSGRFHCDEALGVAMLTLLPEYRDAQIVRSRDLKVLETCSLILDVGGIYDPQTFRFDHHQKEFNQYFSENHTLTKLSSSGLIYKHFGKRILKDVFGLDDPHLLEIAYPLLYKRFFECVDAIDCGVPMCDGKIYYTDSTTLASQVNRLNPPWNRPDMDADKQFEKAVILTGKEFKDQVKYLIEVILPSHGIVRDAYSNRYTFEKSGKLLILEQPSPFIDIIHEIEEESNLHNKILYVVSPTSPPQNDWAVRAMPEKNNPLKSRLPLPQRMRGLRDTELVKAADIKGVDDLVFVHSNGFIGFAKSKNSAIELARVSMNETFGT